MRTQRDDDFDFIDIDIEARIKVQLATRDGLSDQKS
jgi:hypothetical protein